MARTGGVNVAASERTKSLLDAQIDNLKKQLVEKLRLYKNANGVEHTINIVEGKPAQIKVEKNRRETDNYDFINPKHYVQDDGKQTWERMVDKWGIEKTALWMEMTAFKYQDRIGKKPGEDIEREQNKIKWYEEKGDELNDLAKKKKFW